MLAKAVYRPSFYWRTIRPFGVLQDMESKLRMRFNPSDLKVQDPNGDLYKVNVRDTVIALGLHCERGIQGHAASRETSRCQLLYW